MNKKLVFVLLIIFSFSLLSLTACKAEKKKLSLQEQKKADALLLDSLKKKDVKKAIEALNKGANPNATFKVKNTFPVIFFTLYLKDKNLLSEFFKHGANPNIQDDTGNTLLHMAASGQLDIAYFKIILEAGADPNIKNNKKIPAYFNGLLYLKDPEYIKLLAKHKANFKAKVFNSSILMFALFGNQPISTLRLLVEKGAEINARNDKGYTPLLTAVMLNKLEAVKFLVENNADVNSKANDGSTPLSAAKKVNNKEMAEYLKSKGAK